MRTQMKVFCHLLLENHIYKMFTGRGTKYRIPEVFTKYGSASAAAREISNKNLQTSFIFFCCELRLYASHVSPLFRTSGNVRTKICSEQNINFKKKSRFGPSVTFTNIGSQSRGHHSAQAEFGFSSK